MINLTKNITNSGLEQISYKKDSTIYKINEKPKKSKTTNTKKDQKKQKSSKKNK